MICRSRATAPSSRSPATSSSSKTRSRVCAALAALLITSALTSCASVSSPAKASPEIFQPRILRLAAGQPVPTRDGVYSPQHDETWHSPAAFAALERENLNLASALTQERNRRN